MSPFQIRKVAHLSLIHHLVLFYSVFKSVPIKPIIMTCGNHIFKYRGLFKGRLGCNTKQSKSTAMPLILLALAGLGMGLKPRKRDDEDVTATPFLPQTPSIWNHSATVCLGILLCGSEGRARFVITTVLRNTSEGHYYPTELRPIQW